MWWCFHRGQEEERLSLTAFRGRYHVPIRARRDLAAVIETKGGALGIEKAERTAAQRAGRLTEHPLQGPRSELRCANCGYGAIAALPIRCPMCGSDVWDFVDWRPFAR
jgi:hypothetical protein